jgi:6-phosphofructokinase 1
MGTKLAAKAVDWMIDQLKKNVKPDGSVHAATDDSAVMIGIVRRQYKFTPLVDLTKDTDFE